MDTVISYSTVWAIGPACLVNSYARPLETQLTGEKVSRLELDLIQGNCQHARHDTVEFGQSLLQMRFTHTECSVVDLSSNQSDFFVFPK